MPPPRLNCEDCGTRLERNGVCPNCDEEAFIEDWQELVGESDEFRDMADEGHARAKVRLRSAATAIRKEKG